MHTSLDGFVARENGGMDWIKFDDTLFDFVGKFTEQADAALYGRVTYEMMDSYWPMAGDKPNASKHDIEHSQWYNKVDKIVISRTLRDKKAPKTIFISEQIPNEIRILKQKGGKDILIFGSPSVVHTLLPHNLIDEFWVFVNPVILGNGKPLFSGIKEDVVVKPGPSKDFSCGVTALHYTLAHS
jgi:dihydrofolate reductase